MAFLAPLLGSAGGAAGAAGAASAIGPVASGAQYGAMLAGAAQPSVLQGALGITPNAGTGTQIAQGLAGLGGAPQQSPQLAPMKLTPTQMNSAVSMPQQAPNHFLQYLQTQGRQ